jgi:hypothetical protein
VIWQLTRFAHPARGSYLPARVRVHVCMCACMCVRKNACVHVCMHISIFIHSCIYVSILYVYTHIVYKCTHAWGLADLKLYTLVGRFLTTDLFLFLGVLARRFVCDVTEPFEHSILLDSVWDLCMCCIYVSVLIFL